MLLKYFKRVAPATEGSVSPSRKRLKSSKSESASTPFVEDVAEKENGVTNSNTSSSTTSSTSTCEPVSSKNPLDDLEKRTMSPDWYNTFKAEFSKPYFQKIKENIQKELSSGKKVYPPLDEIYSFTKCPLKDIKAVILGQDPYHGKGQAHGLAFSVKKGIALPPSLRNIYKELANDFGADKFQHPGHGFLEGWSKQGVLLLNASLTVRAENANSHSGYGWQEFTDAIIEHINKNSEHVVFFLWGAFSQKKAAKVDSKKHLILKSVHPSPLSAHRGFFGSNHFSKCNEYLVKNGKQPVDWSKLDE